ncbi:Reverse transcriptase/ribonuclease H [Mycena sanguinolenta]|uniref:Reverse transcriptase/ribonuclease H n=1 Tax=Mycena sanguinolenta TaxID=230812 RepID=A0A8H6XTV3_9AGAR|nr:Reverse transcriptase/ribonuclease H [Mycena sanguinolenta]
MEILTVDPNLQFCPDFTSSDYDDIRQNIAANGALDDAGAAEKLRTAWTSSNTAKKLVWDQQVQRDRDAADAIRQAREQEAENLRLAAEKEAETERKEAEKKKPKLADFDDNRGVGDRITIRPSPFAVKKLDEFSYIELYYFTPEGCTDAADQQRAVAEEGFALSRTDDALALRPISSFKASRNVIKDVDLTWRQMEMGANGLLEQMTRSKWPTRHTASVATFFYTLTRHPSRELDHGESILLIYQARARREWHDSLKKDTGFNLALFNDNLLRSISDEYWNKLRAEGFRSVRIVIPSSVRAANITFSPSRTLLILPASQIRFSSLPPRISFMHLIIPYMFYNHSASHIRVSSFLRLLKTPLIICTSYAYVNKCIIIARIPSHYHIASSHRIITSHYHIITSHYHLIITLSSHYRIFSIPFSLTPKAAVLRTIGIHLGTTAAPLGEGAVAARDLNDPCLQSDGLKRILTLLRWEDMAAGTRAMIAVTPGISLFSRAQASLPTRPARSVWAASRTMSTRAHPPISGTATGHSARGIGTVILSHPMAHNFASNGNYPAHARALLIPSAISAQGVETRIMELSAALERRMLRAITPLKPDAWEHLLSAAGLLHRYPHICFSLRHGFDIGIRPITISHTPFNSPTLLDHANAFAAIVEHEFRCQRYIGPFTQAELESCMGPFQSSPLSLIPKAHSPQKLRLVQNFSFPHTPSHSHISINHSIDSDSFPSTWGTFNIFALSCSRLPPGSQGAIRDVAEAYRTVPTCASQWPGAVVRLSPNDEFAVDTCVAFGVSSGSGAYGNLADAGADILRSQGIGPLGHWVDDHCFLRVLLKHLARYNLQRKEWRAHIISAGGRHHDGGRIWFGGGKLAADILEEFDEDMAFPIADLSTASVRSPEDARYSYNFADIDRVTTALGMPWALDKDIMFAHEFPFTGFVWNLIDNTVSLGSEKKTKYLLAIQEWSATRTHALKDVQQLHGKLLHACSIIPEGRAYLTSLEAMLHICHNRPFMPHTPPHSTPADLEWWAARLTQPVLSRSIPGPVELYDPWAYSDASSGIGIGIIIRNFWWAWTLLPGWKSDERDIGWAEAVGFELVVRALIALDPFRGHAKIHGDNDGVVKGWWNHRSRNREVNLIFRRLHILLKSNDYTVHTRYVCTAANPADGPSRGKFPPRRFCLPRLPIPLELQPFIADFDHQPLERNTKHIPDSSRSAFALDANTAFEGMAISLANEQDIWRD